MEKVKITKEELRTIRSVVEVSSRGPLILGGDIDVLRAILRSLVRSQNCISGGTRGRDTNPLPPREVSLIQALSTFDYRPSPSSLLCLMGAVAERSRSREGSSANLFGPGSAQVNFRADAGELVFSIMLGCQESKGEKFLRALARYFLRIQKKILEAGIGALVSLRTPTVYLCGGELVVSITVAVELITLAGRLEPPAAETVTTARDTLSLIDQTAESYFIRPGAPTRFSSPSGELPFPASATSAGEPALLEALSVSSNPHEDVVKTCEALSQYHDPLLCVLTLDSLQAIIATLVRREYYPE